MCNPYTHFVYHSQSPMEKDSLKEATCELIKESKMTNFLLAQLVKKLGAGDYRGPHEAWKTDEQAFMDYWLSVPMREDYFKNQPLPFARAIWSAALAWERNR